VPVLPLLHRDEMCVLWRIIRGGVIDHDPRKSVYTDGFSKVSYGYHAALAECVFIQRSLWLGIVRLLAPKPNNSDLAFDGRERSQPATPRVIVCLTSASGSARRLTGRDRSPFIVRFRLGAGQYGNQPVDRVPMGLAEDAPSSSSFSSSQVFR
jgi:hypothetical protein